MGLNRFMRDKVELGLKAVEVTRPAHRSSDELLLRSCAIDFLERYFGPPLYTARPPAPEQPAEPKPRRRKRKV